MEETTKSTWLQHAIKNGVILGIIHIVLFLILYVAVPSKLTGFSYLLLILVVNFGFVIYQGIQYRKEMGGFIGYGEAFKYAIAVLIINGLIGIVFSIIFVVVVPDFPQFMADSQLNTSVYWAGKFGAPEEALDKIREDFNPEDITKRFTALGMLTGFGIALIFYAIGAAIMAIFIKKNQPVSF
jgi:hypothetical protein